MPFYASPQFHLNAPFMLASTRFWKPMLNGYSGFKPASFYENVEALAQLPGRQARSRTCVRSASRTSSWTAAIWRRPRWSAWTSFPSFGRVTHDGNLRLYLLTGAN